MWKDIDGYEGLYQISDTGEVMNVRTNRIMRAAKQSRGYLNVVLSKNGEKETFLIHRLVAEAFIPNPENKPEVNHKSENKQDNRVENLEWIWHKDNINYGTHNKRMIEKLSKPVLQFSKTGEFIKEWSSLIKIHRELGYDCGNISKCCKGKLKSAYSFIWKYKGEE